MSQRVVQERRLHAMSLPSGMVVVAILGIAFAGVEQFMDGGFILVGISIAGGYGMWRIYRKVRQAPMLEADEDKVIFRPVIGVDRVLSTRDSTLVISNHYIAFRVGAEKDVMMQKGFFRPSEWTTRIDELKKLPFDSIVEGHKE